MTTTASPESTSATDDELDVALVAALRAAPGGTMAWAELRGLLPSSAYWAQVASLVRLQAKGTVFVEKVDGLNYVSLDLMPTTPRRRP